MNKLFSIIGSGFILPKHIQAIFSVGGKVSEIINEYFGADYWKETIKNTEADYVVILTPNDLHYEMAKEALKQNKTVLCEKPLTINYKDAEDLANYHNVFSVLQLRHHPLAKKLKKEIKEEKHDILMDISVHRDESYHLGWKGDKKRSGGILYNLGIHYFDLLIYLFGEPKQFLSQHISDKISIGMVSGDNYNCLYRIGTIADIHNQRRTFKINGESFNFSSKDNLSFENLHQYVYQDLIEGKGVGAEESFKSIRLVEKLYEQILE